MIKNLLSILGLILMFAFCLSCGNSENNSNQIDDNEVKKENTVTETKLPDISGNYKMSENSCGFELIINKEGGEYSYNIKGGNGILDVFGAVSVNNVEGTNYVNFTFPESFSTQTVEGIFDNNTITIQNYGNADNQFHIFEDCDDKYMEFVK
ncbi:MAG: hypothetical protein JXR68_07230 [Bacteroidales bacterium]|nr:hypothetical protein [Bacteroidales bacterium]